MIPPVIVTIYGNVSVGKSVWARQIERLATEKGRSVFVHDHLLFSFAKKFDSDMKKARKFIEQEGYDFGVIVVGTGLNANPPFRMEVDHQGFGALPFYELFFCADVE